MTLICVTTAGGDVPKEGTIVPKTGTFDIHCYVKDAGDLNAAVVGGTWVLCRNGALERESTNRTGEAHWRVSAMEAYYKIELIPPSEYEQPANQSFRWPDDAPLGEFVFISQRVFETPTPSAIPTVDPALYPPDLWPTPVPDYEWPYNFIELTASEQILIIKAAEVCNDEFGPLEVRMTNDLWKAGRSMQLGKQETAAFQIDGFEGMGFSQGIVVMTIPRGGLNEFGVISWFGCWACEGAY